MSIPKITKENKDILRVILVFLIVGIPLTVFLSSATSKNKSEDFWYGVYQDKVELEYWSAKHELVKSIDEYIMSVSEDCTIDGLFLLNMCSEYDVDPIFVLAQGTLESHLGTKGIAAKTNSVFNVGAYSGYSESEIHDRYKYENSNKSIEPYLKLLTTKYLVDGKSEYELLDSYVDKNGRRYASYELYEEDLRHLMKRIEDNTDIRSKYLTFQKYEEITNRK